MAHFIRFIKAVTLKRKLASLQSQKNVALFHGEEESDEDIERDTFLERLNKKWKGGFLERYYIKIKTPKTTENFVMKSLFGFLGGVLLTYIFFIFFFLGVSFTLKNVTYACTFIGISLCLGLAFSSKIRCYVFLLIPVFFSKQGRQAILAYALFLAFTGPARNTIHNMGILSDSMTCGQEIVRRTLRQIFEMVKAPFRSVKEALERMKNALMEVIETVKLFVVKIKRIIVSILKVIRTAASWLGSIINFCNKKVGTPFQRCMKTLDDAIADCKAKLGVMDFMCHVVHIVKGLCYTVKWLDFICMFTEFVSDKIVKVVKRKLNEFSLHMKNLFYVSIDFTHSYEFETVASNSTKHIAKTILQKISSKMERVQNVFSFFGFMFSFLFLFVFFKVYYYKYKYLTSDRFDNIYISKHIVDLDLKRASLGKETVLPLERRERKRFAKPSSLRLLRDEKIRMTESLFLLSLTSFKIITFLLCDYCLFWVLLTIYDAGRDMLEEAEKSKISLHVEGDGVLANFYRNLGKTFQVPDNSHMNLNPLLCLPDPVTPDTGRYIQIGFLLGLCWFLTITEAYGLRLRHVVMSYYYPDRAKERAIWLYNHILRSRGSFLRFARRQLRKRFQGDASIERVTFKQRLFASFPILNLMFGQSKANSCILCGAAETKENPLKRCKTPDCPGKYCINCFATLQNTCTICQHPIEYGDVSDISEEIDSSDEDYNIRISDEASEVSDGLVPEENFLTFKEMEIRDRFRDVEANQIVEYAKLSDLHDRSFIEKKLKQALKTHLKKLKAGKNKVYAEKGREYERVRKKLKNFITKLKKSKLGISEQKLIRKHTLKQLKSSLRIINSSLSANSEENPSTKRSRVSFKLSPEKASFKLGTQYADLKDKLRAKVESLKGQKNHPRLLVERNTSNTAEMVNDVNLQNDLPRKTTRYTGALAEETHDLF